jgi:hypothetical protein
VRSSGLAVVISVCALVALGGGAAFGADLVVEQTAEGTALRIGNEQPFRVTTAAVVGARLLELSDGATSVVTWTETAADGSSTPFYALGLRGGPVERSRATSYQLELHHGGFDPLASAAPVVEPALAARASSELYLVQFVTQPLQDYRDALTGLGAHVRHFMPHHALVVEMSDAVREQVAALDFVRWIGPYHPAYRVERVLRADADTIAQTVGTRRYNILLFETGDAHKQALASRLQAIGAVVEQADAGKYLMVATLTPQQVIAVAHWDEIAYIDRWSPLEPDMDLVRKQGGADELEVVAGYTGHGVRAESFDDGFNLDHPDFASRPPLVHGGDVSTNSHGTATLGVCFGDGTGDPKARGLLPDGQPIAADYNNVGLSGQSRYDHAGELLESPFFAVFQTASVGSARTTEYTTISADHDTMLFDWDIVHCQSQSNAGNQNSRPQAWAKNVVSGGAFNHYDTEDTSDDCWCSTASIGPAADGRIKPDLSFYYDDTYTTYSSGDGYGQFGGTSGATPSICGHFGLFFQMWSDGIFGNDVDPTGTVFENRPHMTTAKAFMINTAVQYPFEGADHDMTRVHQGWGVPNVKRLYDLRDDISFVDETDILYNGGVADYNAFVEAGTESLKVTMTYADPAGNPAATVHRINDLSLRVTSPSGTVYWGNFGLDVGNWSAPGGEENNLDTVENVFVENPEGGLWLIEVIATEIVEDGHVETADLDADFALVVSGGEISNCSSDGEISLNKRTYACEDEVRVRVVDCDLNLDDEVLDTVEVTVESDSEPGGEIVVLTETDVATGTFTGGIMTAEEDAPGTLQVAHADLVVATYVDEDDGQGGTNITKTAEADVDCREPLISNVHDEDVGLDYASIVWTTDERSTSVLRYGETIPPTIEERGYGRTTDHRIDIDGLAECTTYYYEVESTDALDNMAIDNNGLNYYTFETLGDFGAGPVSCHRGEVKITEDLYSCHDSVLIRLSDLDVNQDPELVETLIVDVTSTTETTPEAVQLTETGPNTSTFEGSIATGSGAVASDGILQTRHADLITATYHDADDGTGSPALSFDTAETDCIGPGITDVTVTEITDQRATIEWKTQVPADTHLEWGFTPDLGQTVSDGALKTTHSVMINRSTDCGVLYFRISGTDGFGDSSTSDENGTPYAFNTGTVPGLYFKDDFESGANGWTLQGEWEIGPPEGKGGSSGRPDPDYAYNNDGVLGHDLTGLGAWDGDYEPNIKAERAMSPTFDASEWRNTKLIYYRNLHTDADDRAELRIWFGHGYSVWNNEDADVNDSDYVEVSFDLGAAVDGAASVRFEFLQSSNAEGQYSGWTLDDFILKDGSLPDWGACGTCEGQPSFKGADAAFDNDACGASGVTVEWTEAVAWGTGGEGTYAVYRGESPDFVPGPGNLVASGVSGTSYDDTGAPNDRELWYVVRAETDETCGSGPNGGVLDDNLVRVRVSETTDQPVPDEVEAVDVELLNDAHVRVSWQPVSGATAYRVYRATQPDGSDRGLLGETTELYLDDVGAGANKVNYFYDVVAINACEVEGP